MAKLEFSCSYENKSVDVSIYACVVKTFDVEMTE